MSAEYLDGTLNQVQQHISRLQHPISSSRELVSLLYAPLCALGLVREDRRYDEVNAVSLPSDALQPAKHIPSLQRVLLEHVIPRWWDALNDEGNLHLLERYFYPFSDVRARESVLREVVCSAYSTLLSVPLNAYSLRLVVELVKRCPVERVHHIILDDAEGGGRQKKSVLWEDYIKSMVALPGKVANALLTGKAKAKAVNELGAEEIPPELEYGSYFADVCAGCEDLVAGTASKKLGEKKETLHSTSYLLTKLLTLGLFPAVRPSTPSQPSFFARTLPTIRKRLSSAVETEEIARYSETWQTLVQSFPTSHNLRAFLASLLGHLDLDRPLDTSSVSFPGLSTDHSVRSHVKREALLLRQLVGALDEKDESEKDTDELWESLSAVVLGGKVWGAVGERVVVCWVAGAGEPGQDVDVVALQRFLDRVVDVWTSTEHIKHSLLSFHRYMTLLMLLTLSHLPPPNTPGDITSPLSAPTTELAFSPPFIKSISQYISHLNYGVRECGMIVAESVAKRVGKKIGFEVKSQDGWARAVEELAHGRDVDAVLELEHVEVTEEEAKVMDEFLSYTENATEESSPRDGKRSSTPDSDDDSLLAYASSRSSSPTPSIISDIEKDPTLLGTNNRPVPKPVYLLQLGEMLRGGAGKGLGGIGAVAAVSGEETAEGKVEGAEEAGRVEVALGVAEELVRRRAGFGMELEENAVNLVHVLVGLQDNYDLEGFDVKRQAALNALVACCPKKAAPAVIEQFFINQYSTDQRFAMLNALAMGARELASLPMPSAAAVQPLTGDRVSFPSKKLPPALHRKYMEAAGQVTGDGNPVQKLLMDISKNAVDKTKEPVSEKVPELVRERRLRVRQPTKVTEVKPGSSALARSSLSSAQEQAVAFTEVAAEYFICPLINRFWLFLRDEQAREERTSYSQDRMWQYRGAGSGLILNPVVLSHFIATVAVLVHAARNAKEWLAVIAPDALELAVTLGTRPMSRLEDEDEEGVHVKLGPGEGDPEEGGGRKTEAAVLSTTLELALVVLDGCLDLDGGRSLGLEHTALLLGAGEWAGKVFALLDKGFKVGGGGGVQEARLKRAAAGVLLKVDELSSKWRRSMINL
ncbi:hypothetical protein OE88DRAFT_1732466 [Heliocybe sulcata]|uniref:Telomere length regulation protein conserved domain-containing protein n=1 Tax=Heliocybe sulcata TaxID=5364 RepID=A0A5C3NDU6_9AGAM|nr:hypothetical protein OE88DRAFT_1732466 [Heliocybe sulcata]